MIGLHDAICPVACRRLWVAAFAMQWDMSFGLAGDTTPRDRERAIDWFGSIGFFEVCMLLKMDGHAVLESWRRQQARAACGEVVLPASYKALPSRVRRAA